MYNPYLEILNKLSELTDVRTITRDDLDELKEIHKLTSTGLIVCKLAAQKSKDAEDAVKLINNVGYV